MPLTVVHAGIECPLVDNALNTIVRPADPAKRAHAALFAAAFALGVTRIWVGGYSFGSAGQSWQIPLVRGLASGSLIKDYIFDPAPVLSLFFPLAAVLVRLAGAEAAYFAAYAAASIAAAVGVYLLARNMLSSRPAAILAVVMLLAGHEIAAGAATWQARFLPATAAMPFVLFSWWLFLEERPAFSGVLMGAAFALDPRLGIYGTAITGVAAFVGRNRPPAQLRRFAAGIAAPVAVTLACIWRAPVPVWSAPSQWYQAMLASNVRHITLGNFYILAGVLVFSLAAATYLGLSEGRNRLLFGATAVCAAAFMYSSGAQIAGQFIHARLPERALLVPPIAAVLEPLKVCGPLGILAFIAAAGILWKAMQRGLIERVAAMGSAAALAEGHYAVGTVFLVSAVLAQENSRIRRAAGVILLLAALAVVVVLHKVLLVLILAVVAASFVAALAARNTRVSAASAALVAAVAFLGVVPANWAQRAAGRTFGWETLAPDERFGPSVSVRADGDPEMLEAAKWIHNHAGSDEVTIVPPWWAAFRVAADRPVYGTYDDGTLVRYNCRLAAEWIDRMTSLDVTLQIGGTLMSSIDQTKYTDLGEDDILDAVKSHPAKYVVRMEDDLDGFPHVYKGTFCHIYEIPAEGAR